MQLIKNTFQKFLSHILVASISLSCFFSTDAICQQEFDLLENIKLGMTLEELKQALPCKLKSNNEAKGTEPNYLLTSEEPVVFQNYSLNVTFSIEINKLSAIVISGRYSSLDIYKKIYALLLKTYGIPFSDEKRATLGLLERKVKWIKDVSVVNLNFTSLQNVCDLEVIYHQNKL